MKTADVPIDPDPILARIPAKDAASAREIGEALTRGGPPLIERLIASLGAFGDPKGVKPTYAIHAAVVYASRPGADPERAMVAATLARALSKDIPVDAKVLIVSQLQLCGTRAEIPALRAVLGDERLCEPAAHALLAIGGPDAAAALREALAASKGKTRGALVKAAGEIGDAAAAASLREAARGARCARRDPWEAREGGGSTMTKEKISRRRFLGAAATATGAFTIVPRRVLAGASEPPPSDTVTTALIGCGQRGAAGLGCVGAHTMIARCDVDVKHLGGEPDQKTRYTDFRRLLERSDLDVVCIATPPHWHALICIAAAQAGKDIFCEKPMTRFIAEGRAVAGACRRYGVIFQIGTFGRFDERKKKESVETHKIMRHGLAADASGLLHRFTVPMRIGKPDLVAQPVPPEIDYDLWLGPAPWKPYNAARVHYNNRFYWDYEGGDLANFGAHNMDPFQWRFAKDETGPVEIEPYAEWPSTPMRSARGAGSSAGMRTGCAWSSRAGSGARSTTARGRAASARTTSTSRRDRSSPRCRIRRRSSRSARPCARERRRAGTPRSRTARRRSSTSRTSRSGWAERSGSIL